MSQLPSLLPPFVVAHKHRARPIRGLVSLCLGLQLLLGGCARANAPVAPGAEMPGSKRPRTLAAATARAGAQDFRHHVPDTGPKTALLAPIPKQMQLANGLQLWLVQKRDLPLVMASVVIKAGSAKDPSGQEGLANLLVDTMKLATQHRDAQAIADEVETRGASLDVGVSEDAMTFEVQTLTQNVAPVLAVLADVLQFPLLSERDVTRAKDARLAELTQLAGMPQASARQVFRRVAFGSHPYGHSSRGRTDTVQQVSQAALQAFHREHFRPSNAALVLVGDADEAQARQWAEQALGSWHGAARPDRPAPTASDLVSELTVVDRPGAPQSQVMVGALGVERASPDYYALSLCNAILGGLFNSRINMNLREEKGWTYGARSQFSFLRSRGSFVVGAGIRTDVTAPAIHEILAEVDRIRTEPVTEQELLAAKNRAILSLPGALQTVEAIGDMVTTLVVHDLPPAYLEEMPAKLSAVSVADVQRVAKAYLHPEQMHVVVVGDRKAVAEGLMGLRRGAVTLRDSEGNLLAQPARPAAPEAAATP